MILKIYYKQLGSHTHCGVFLDIGKCGDLVFRNDEFAKIKTAMEQRSDAGLKYQFLDCNNAESLPEDAG